MNLKRIVTGSQSIFFPEGGAFTIPAAGIAGVASKPGATDPAFLVLGAIKWSKNPTHKTENYMEASPGSYVATDEIVLSKGITLKGKLEKQSNFAVQLQQACAALPVSPAAGGVFNPLSGPPVVRGWLHVQEYDQNDTLVNTVDYWVAMKASGDTNNDDKATETPIEAVVLFSTLNVGTLA
ncbi:MAG TPA: hypothetical protein VGG34_01475 [Opitutaceae bacterium]|jgi:hypothetical protein